MRRPDWHGFKDMGRIRIPPLPSAIHMTDRQTGTVYFLTRNVTATEIVLSSTPYGKTDRVFYGPHDGPYTDGHRLYVENGDLLAEPAENHFSAPVMARGPQFQRLLGRINVVDGQPEITPVQL